MPLMRLAGHRLQIAVGLFDIREPVGRQYGKPMHKNRQGRWVETGFAIVGMGKLGGHELNYSSDVDLIYVYASHEGETRAASARAVKPMAAGISNEEYFEILSRELTKALSEQTREGYVFRVDLRLRAEGSVGQLARSVEDYRKYYFTRGADLGATCPIESLASSRLSGSGESLFTSGQAVYSGSGHQHIRSGRRHGRRRGCPDGQGTDRCEDG